jgi:hypothetical protein
MVTGLLLWLIVYDSKNLKILNQQIELQELSIKKSKKELAADDIY